MVSYVFSFRSGESRCGGRMRRCPGHFAGWSSFSIMQDACVVTTSKSVNHSVPHQFPYLARYDPLVLLSLSRAWQSTGSFLRIASIPKTQSFRVYPSELVPHPNTNETFRDFRPAHFSALGSAAVETVFKLGLLLPMQPNSITLV